MSLPSDNLILRTDSYKASTSCSTRRARRACSGISRVAAGCYGETVFFGLQYLLDAYSRAG